MNTYIINQSKKNKTNENDKTHNDNNNMYIYIYTTHPSHWSSKTKFS